MESQLMLRMRELLDALEGNTEDPADLNNTLHHIAHIAKTFFAADSCVIFAINPITNRFIGSLTVAGNLLKRDNISYKQPRPQGIAPQVLKRGVLVVEDLETAPEYHSAFTRSEGIRSFTGLALRMKPRQRSLGVLYLNFIQQRCFSADEHELFQVFADQASFILQETWLLRRYQEVARIGQEINQELSTVDTLFQRLRKHAAEILDTSFALLLVIYQQQANTFDLYLEEEGRFIFRENHLPGGASQYIIKTQETIFIEQSSKDAKHLPFQITSIPGTEPKESFIFVPLTLRNVSLGVLSIQHPLPNVYNQEDLSILQLLANHIALALHNMHLYHNLGRLNETGQLLTQQLDSKQTLQAIVDKIYEATQADIIVLYPYKPDHQHFVLPPRVAGTLLDSTSLQYISLSQPDDIASLMLHHMEPIFAKESAILYTELQNNVPIRQGNFQEREHIRSTVALPLQVGDESVGVLFINFRQPQRFDATQKLFIEGLAHYAAIAIKNSQVFGTLSQRRLRELEILQNIDRQLSRTLTLDLETVLNTLLKLAHEHVPAEEASILLYNNRTHVLKTAVAIGRHAEASRKQAISLQESRGITRWVVENKKPARVDNVHYDLPWRDLHLAVAPDIVSELDVPLLDDDKVIGVLNFESTREGAFQQDDQNFLLTLAGQAVLAIKNAQAYEREKRLAEEGKVLNEISREITSQLDHVHVFDLILKKALGLTGSTSGTLMLYDRDQNDLWMAAEHGVAEDKKGKRLGLHQGVVGFVATKKQLRNVDPSQPPWSEIYLDYIPGTRSELAVPMLAGNDLRGVLDVESPNPNNFSRSDEHLLKGLADLAVVALQNAERYQQAEKEAQRFKMLYQAGQELGRITALEQLEQAYDVILHIAAEYSQSEVVIRRFDEDSQELVMMRTSDPQYFPLFGRKNLDVGINGQVARERRTILIHNTNNPPPGVASAQLSDPTTRSLLVTPIMFKERYYGNLGLRHKDIGHFQDTDIIFFEGLAQQLATTIYRLETAKARQEFEQRALSAEEMSSIGQSAFEVTHRLGNDLGLVELYVSDIQYELEKLGVTNALLSRKLKDIVQSVQDVLSLSTGLKNELAKLGDKEETAGEPVLIAPRVLLEEAQAAPSLPPNIQICLEIEADVTPVRVLHSLVADILRNLIANAIQAMPEGGKITLRARNTGRSVAIEVTDTGVGIPPQKLSNIFDLFFSTKGSSGFGLWSARRNALRNRGDLKVESKLGQSTTFTLLLPRIDVGQHEVIVTTLS